MAGNSPSKTWLVYPLLSTYSVPLDYLTLDEALTGNVLDIVEVDKDGSVPDLKVKNWANWGRAKLTI